MGGRRAPLVVCWGELLWDLFPDGRRLGGAPANVAYHARALGNRAALVSRVGRDAAGDDAIAALSARGVDARYVQRDELPTGSVVVEVIDGEPRYAIGAPSAFDRIALTPAVERLLSRAAAFCYGTLSRRADDAGRAALARALATVPAGCLRVCDVNLRSPYDTPDAIRAALATADVVKMNEEEAARIGAAARPGQILAITRGAAGSELIAGEARAAAAGVAVDTSGGDAVGAGDAFTAALIDGLLRRRPLAEVNERANRYAAYVASRAGAMPPIPPEVRRAFRSKARARAPARSMLLVRG